MEETRRLTKTDKKEIKFMIKMGYILPRFLFPIAGLIAVLILFVSFNSNNLSLILTEIGILLFCILVSYRINRKYYKDLKSGVKKIKLETVRTKEGETGDAGSGAIFTVISGVLPKSRRKKFKPHYQASIVINNYRYRIDKELYDKISEGETVEMHYSMYSETMLGVYKI